MQRSDKKVDIFCWKNIIFETNCLCSTNIKTTTLTCNDHKFWTVENGIDGETCSNKKGDDRGKFFEN